MRMPPTLMLGVPVFTAALIASWAATAVQPPHELQIVATKYQFTPSTIEVTAVEPTRLVLRSMDVVHGFAIPKLQIDVRLPKNGDPVVVEFIAPPAGRYEIDCSEFCGNGHAQMKAALVSTAPRQPSQ